MTKLIRCDGRELTVREVGPAIMTIRSRAGGPPIKVNGCKIMEDDEARDLVRELLQIGEYDNVRA